VFEKIVLRRSESGPPLSVGEVAEALLFYQNVHLVLDYGTLNGFIERIGMQRLLGLLARPNVSAVYCEETLCMRTDRVGSLEAHSFVAFTLSGDQKVGQLTSRKNRLEYVLERHGHNRRDSRKLVERFRRHVPIRKLTDNYFLPGGVLNAASDDLRDPTFVHEAMRHVIANTIGAPALLGDFRFEIISTPPTFHVVTNVDFNRINEGRRNHQPSLDNISAAHFVNEILMARADTALAAHYGGEFYTSALSSQIVRLRYRELLKRAGINAGELREFQEITLPESRTIREVIDSGERSFDEFLSLLDKSQRFRDWIQGVNPDEKLVHAYLSDVTAEGWISKLPSKTLRYVLGSIVGAVSPAVGLGLSAVDSLFLEKILGGWRPSHFIEGKLKPFLSKSEYGD
jgi:hypothetical protein